LAETHDGLRRHPEIGGNPQGEKNEPGGALKNGAVLPPLRRVRDQKYANNENRRRLRSALLKTADFSRSG